jgi:hypothetical protein
MIVENLKGFLDDLFLSKTLRGGRYVWFFGANTNGTQSDIAPV